MKLFVGTASAARALPSLYLPLPTVTVASMGTGTRTCNRCQKLWARHFWVLCGDNDATVALDCSEQPREWPA